MPLPTLFKKFLLHVVIAPWSLAKIACKINERNEGGKTTIWWYAVPSFLLFFLFILFHIINIGISGFWAIGWFWYFCFCSYLAAIRLKIREIVGIHGSAIEDFLSCVLLYPSASLQIEETFKNVIFIQSPINTNIQEISGPTDYPQGKTNEGFQEE